jgi:diphthine synthase
MIGLVGLGIDKGDISLKAVDFLKKCDIIMIDTYTSNIPDEYLDLIKNQTGKELKLLERKELEDQIKETLEPAKKQNLALLVGGDPLIATTHTIIISAARKMDIDTIIFHSSSILSAAIGESGMSTYKFGSVTTIPFWSDNYKPVSFLETINANLSRELHSFVLLDYDSLQRRSMMPDQAISLLVEADKQKGFGIIDSNREIIILGNIGKSDQKIRLVKIADVPKVSKEFSNMLVSLIIPAKMSFPEIEASNGFRV